MGILIINIKLRIENTSSYKISNAANPQLIKAIIENADEQDKMIIQMLSGWHTQSEIAKELGVSQSTISKKIKKIREAYKDKI